MPAVVARLFCAAALLPAPPARSSDGMRVWHPACDARAFQTGATITADCSCSMRDARQSSQWLVEPTEQQKQTTDGTSRTWSNSYATACANAFRTVPRTLSVIVQWPLSWSHHSAHHAEAAWCRDCGASACAVASLGHAPLRPRAAIAPKRAHVRAHSQAQTHAAQPPATHTQPHTLAHESACTTRRTVVGTQSSPVQSRPVPSSPRGRMRSRKMVTKSPKSPD